MILVTAVVAVAICAAVWFKLPRTAAGNRVSAEPGSRELSAQELFARASPAVVRVVVRDRQFKVTGMGSGFFISDDGLLVTNYHVIKGAESADILRADNST
ncbi:hypothetical protein [Fontivita pretiosa]|jgi:S1-C subfamily serine protease|uniref:hypothetical protein n=1 Tax=Fontivita pretiosa TaxID=2989684 RepID=UPI003D165B89